MKLAIPVLAMVDYHLRNMGKSASPIGFTDRNWIEIYKYATELKTKWAMEYMADIYANNLLFYLMAQESEIGYYHNFNRSIFLNDFLNGVSVPLISLVGSDYSGSIKK